MLVKSKVKYIQSLGQKKFRDEEQVFVAEGPKLVKELLEAGNARIKEIYALQEWADEQAALLLKQPVTIIPPESLEKISQLNTPNQVLAVVKQFDAAVPAETNGKIVLALDGIQDPGNLGTIIRIADWFGVPEIVCQHGTADLYNSKVVQSTMGSIARVSVSYTDLAGWLVTQTDSRIYATVLEGQDITTMKKLREGILLIGNESKGISPELLEKANVRITIPRIGQAESLNAAVAAGIILSHLT